MKNTEELRDQVSLLEQDIEVLVNSFYKKVGRCKVDINLKDVVYGNEDSTRELFSTKVEVKVTI